jgi:hypothetical protein
MKNLVKIIILFFSISFFAQNNNFYIRVISHDFNPSLTFENGKLKYNGKDRKLIALFNNNNIFVFEKAFNSSRRSNLQRTFKMQSDASNTLDKFLQKAGHIFEYGENLGIEVVTLASYPNDYGQTGGTNQGLNANLSNLDFIDAPLAWDITTGNSSISIGISDGGVLVNDAEFQGRITALTNSTQDEPHGTGVTAIAAAKGDNSYGIPGICYDCDIISTYWNGGDYNRILELSYAGAKVINCSWGSYSSFSQCRQDMIDEVYDNGSIVVAASHNDSWTVTQGQLFSYPASYNHVISVGSVSQRNESVLDSITYIPSLNEWWSHNVKDHISRVLRFTVDPNLNPNATYTLHTNGTNTLNTAVDILAPGNEIFSYGNYLVNNVFSYGLMATSSAAPHVTGSIGLMLSLNSCLTFEETESILKITSTNIDYIQANAFAVGNYGSGSLNTGRAVKLTDALIKPDSIAYVENQIFSRWDFVLKAVSENVIIRNQEFKDDATLQLTAKNSIEITESTLLEPNLNGFIDLIIDDVLVINTNCPPPSNNSQAYNNNGEDIIPNTFTVVPTAVKENVSIIGAINNIQDIHTVKVYNLFGLEVFKEENINAKSVSLKLSRLPQGLYIIKVYNTKKEVVHTQKIIKQ